MDSFFSNRKLDNPGKNGQSHKYFIERDGKGHNQKGYQKHMKNRLIQPRKPNHNMLIAAFHTSSTLIQSMQGLSSFKQVICLHPQHSGDLNIEKPFAPRGAQRWGKFGPNKMIWGVPTPAAMCPVPVSFPIKSWACLNRAANSMSGRDVIFPPGF